MIADAYSVCRGQGQSPPGDMTRGRTAVEQLRMSDDFYTFGTWMPDLQRYTFSEDCQITFPKQVVFNIVGRDIFILARYQSRFTW